MAEQPNLDPNAPPQSTPPPGGEPQPVQPSLPPEVEQELAFLRQYHADTKEFVDQTVPIAPVVRRLIEDEGMLGAARTAMEGLEDWRKRQPQKTEMEKNVEELVDFVKENKSANAKFQAQFFVQGLAQKYPFLAENGWDMAGKLQKEAEELGMSFERNPMQVARYIEKVVSRTPGKPAGSPPPQSLRGDAGEPGIPGRPEDKPKDPQQIREWLINQARRANASGG